MAHPEYEYLDLVEKVLSKGVDRRDRTGVGTTSLFGTQSRYPLTDWRLPVLTTKEIHLKSVIEELLWFVKGCTDSKKLSEKGVRIWDANGSREFLDENGFHHRREGDLGPVYGFQWRHFGAEYKDADADYSGKGIDQLTNVVRQIKTNPESRRIILCSWNVSDIDEMALPPCHCLAQFYVHDKTLSCHLYQRSGDVGLGVPYNITCYSLLTMMIAHVTDLKPGEFVHTIGDAHVYKTHVDALRRQLERKPTHPFPILRFERKINKLEDFEYSDFVVENYVHQGKIRMPMAV